VPTLSGSTEIELVLADHLPGSYKFGIFDFDGTLSLIREGWREIMIPMMVETLSDLGSDESEPQIERIVGDFVDELTGQQTIFQMIRLCEEIAARGGQPDDPAVYKKEFHDRLLAHIAGRVERLESGASSREEMSVPGSLAILKALQEKGLELYLASGTDHEYVVQEAKLLGIADYFSGGIYGARENFLDFSKAQLIAEILDKNDISGQHLLGFGDGYVEIENVSQVGGTAIGVATNETTRQGVNTWKRERLIKAGAALIIPHYRELNPLLDYLFPGT
jgi:phosphoglycolate phosphatase